MPKSMEEIMRRILPVLLSLFVLIAVTEGGVVLCKTSPKSNAHNYPKAHSSSNSPMRALRDESSNLRSDDDNFNEDFSRKESSHDKILRAMLMEDSEASNYRAENPRNDYSALEASLRADLLRDEARRNEDEWTRRRMESNSHIRYDNNWYGKDDDYYN